MKKFTLISFVLVLFGFNLFSQTTDKKIFVAIDGLAPAAKVGVEKIASQRLSWKASVGFCIVGPSLISYNYFGTYKISNPEKPFGFDVNFGFLDNYIDVVTPMFSLGLGGGPGIHYQFKNNSVLSFRLGLITGPSVEKREFSMLTLPNFGIEFAFPLRKGERKK